MLRCKKLLRRALEWLYLATMLQRSKAPGRAGRRKAEEQERNDAVAEAKVTEIKKIATEAAAQGAATAKKFLEEGTAQARATMEKGMDQMTKTAEGLFKAAEEFAEFSRGNYEAVTKSAQLWATGSQDLARQYMAVAQGFTDQALEGAKALAAVKSLNEAAELQAKLVKATLEKSVAEGTKFQEAVFKLAEQALAPLTARVSVAVEKIGKPLAA